jgi:hypothetical protein
MAPNSSLSKNRRSSTIPYDDPVIDDHHDGGSSPSSNAALTIVIADSSMLVAARPLPNDKTRSCLSSSDMGAVLQSLPEEADELIMPPPALVRSVSDCTDTQSSMNGDGSMNSSFGILDKLVEEEEEALLVGEVEETVDALSAVAADGRPMFYQFQDVKEKSISNRSRTCFDNGDSKHSTRSSYDHSNRTTRVRTIEMEDDLFTSKKKKTVQFAECTNGSSDEVQSTTHVYPKAASNAPVTDLWWSSDEWALIKKKIRKAVHHYKMHAHETKYSEAIRGLMYSYRKSSSPSSSTLSSSSSPTSSSSSSSSSGTKAYMATLLHCSDARGLESYIVGHSKALTDAHLDAVLKAQHDVVAQYGDMIQDHPDKAMEDIRKAAKKSSRPARQLALKLAESDTYQALRATLSSWKTSTTTTTTT